MNNLHKYYNFNLNLCPNLKDYQIPLYLKFDIKIGKKYSVIYNGKLMSIRILSKEFEYGGIINWVQVLEYAAKKVIKSNK